VNKSTLPGAADSLPRAAGSTGNGPGVALLCAGGAMPLIVAEEARSRGQELFLIGIEGLASKGISAFQHEWIRLGQLGRFLDLVKGRGIGHVAVVGALARPHLMDLRLDIGAIRRLPAVIRVMGGGGDDALLRRLIDLVESREGLAIVGVQDIAPGLVIGKGALGRHAPDGRHLSEAQLGRELIAALSPFDSGQAVVIMDGRAVAIEGVEGTDAMLERVAALRASGRLRAKGRRGVLVKAPKTGQDMRIDMPVIGPETLRLAACAGLSGVAVQAGGVLVAGLAATRAAADSGKLFVQGI
jgi:UDP-2,3-diacylglucosamine hydrolase